MLTHLTLKTVSCDFEDDMCFWSHTTLRDDYDWVRASAANSNGPSTDHETGSSGRYSF